MEIKRKIHVALWALLLMILIPCSAFGKDGQIEQTLSTIFPIIIDQPGNYALASDLVVSTPGIHCLQVISNDVIIDLRGHRLVGPGRGESGPASDIAASDIAASGGAGIYASGGKNIAVLNGTVTGFFCGVSLSGAYHEVKNINACNNSSCGIKAISSLITDCTANNNGSHGIAAESCTIVNCTADFNDNHGIEAESCTITGCTANDNSSQGIYVSGKCRLEGCSLKGNNRYGLYLDPDYSYAIKNRFSDNALGNFNDGGLNYLPTKGDNANLSDDANLDDDANLSDDANPDDKTAPGFKNGQKKPE